MLLLITCTQSSATDLGFLLHKNPARMQSFSLSFGKAHVFYPEASDDRCTAAMMLDVDPVALVRGKGSFGDGPLSQYVNDRPYVASSFLSVAISQVYGTALAGRCKERPELVDAKLPLEVTLAVVPCRGGEALLRRLFEPLGYEVSAERHPLDEHFPGWGDSPYYTVNLKASAKLSDLLTHLYVLIPVLDDEKHYYVGDDEVEKLLRMGAGWLSDHPERELIASRYLKHRKSLAQEALSRLEQEEDPDPDAKEIEHAAEEAALEAKISLNTLRLEAVLSALKESGAKRVLDLGCGEGNLLRLLLKEPQFAEIVGMDVSCRALEGARDRIRFDQLAPKQQERIRLIQGSLMYRDKRLAGYDAAAVVEVIEHLDPPRLAAFERALFEFARPHTVVLATPNVEYNAVWESLPAGKFRHKDHRFEWTRAEFRSWAERIISRFGYSVEFRAIGPGDEKLGSPTQMAVFSLK